MERLFGDLTSGVRMLVRYPTLSLSAILTLGIGIGLSTTVFCVVNAGMFKGLPLPNAASAARGEDRSGEGAGERVITSLWIPNTQHPTPKTSQYGAFGSWELEIGN
jgi:hypothetical protein